jgi:hypothetical protein
LATALREILAEFQIKVDLTELTAADAAINQFIGKLKDLEAAMKRLPKVDAVGKTGEEIKSTTSWTSRLVDLVNQHFRAVNQSEQAVRHENQAQAAKVKQSKDVAEAIANEIKGMTLMQQIRARFGSESSRRAQGELIPGGAIKNLQEASREGDGLFAVLGRLRRMWGLLQFSVSGGFALAGIKGLINEMDEASKQATRLNMTIEEYQTVAKFAELAGASTASLSNVMKQLAKNTINAAEGAKAQAAAFKELGVETKNNDGTFKDTTTLLFEVGGALGELEDGTKRLALAQKLLGKEAMAILPAFKDGKEAALAQLEALRELAVAYDQETADAAEAFNDTLDISIHQLRAVALQGVSILLPYLVSLVNWLSQTAKQLKDLMRGSSALQSAMIGLGVAIGGHVVSKLLLALTNLKALRMAMLRVMQVALRFVVPFLLLESLVTWLRGGDSYLGRLLDKFKPGNKDSKAWLETVLRGFDKIKQALDLLESAWRVFRTKFWAKGELLKPEDIANNAELLKLWEEIKAGANKAFLEIWAVLKAEAGKALKEMWKELFKPRGPGVPDESAIVAIGSDIGLWVLSGLALKLAGSVAINIATEFAKGFTAEIARVMVLGGRTAITALIGGMTQASSALFARALILGSGVASSIGAGILAAMAAVTAPVMAVAVAAGAVLLLIFSEKAREVAYDIGEKLVDGIIWIVRAIKGWGPKIWEAAKFIAKGFVQAHIDAVNAIVEYVPKIKDALVDAITNFNWGDFLNAGLIAIKRLGSVIADVFSAVGDFLKNPFAFLEGIGAKIKSITDNVERIAWGSEGRGISNLTEDELNGIRNAGGVIAPGTIRTPQTIIDKRSVSQTFTGAQDPAEVKRATSGAVKWAEGQNKFLDAEEVGY